MAARLPHAFPALTIASMVVVLGGAPTHAVADPLVSADAEPVLAHAIEATGGSDARAEERVVHSRGRIEAGGLEGRWDQWTAAPDRWMRRMVLGPLHFREGYDGQVAWRTDMSEKAVEIESAADAAHERDEGWFLNERWALADHDSARVRRLSRVYGDGFTYDVLEITPPGGLPRKLYVNDRTGFIERTVTPVDQQTVEERLDDYRRMAGRQRAGVLRTPTLLESDHPVEQLTVDSVWVNQRIDTTIFSPPAVHQRQLAWRGDRRTVRVPFLYAAKAVIVKVSINDMPPTDFILDTGCTSTLIDQNYAYSIGLHPEGEMSVDGISASAGLRFATVDRITLPGGSTGVTLNDFKVGVLDLGRGSELMMWTKTSGLLGSDFLSRFVVTIDYDSAVVTLHDPTTFRYTGDGAGIPFEFHEGIPLVDVTLDDGCSGKFVVDVGNSVQMLVHGTAVRGCRMLQDKKRKEVPISSGGIGGGFESTMCRLDSVRIGPYEWSEPVATLALGTHGGIGSLDIAGNLGNTVLERFRCTLDYAHQTLYLEPGRRYGERDEVSRFGALFIRWGRRVFVGNVVTGSAAYEAGLRWYDEIVAVDGKPLENWTRQEIDRVLEEGVAGSVHRVTYSRFDEPEKTVTVTLKDVL